jgi:uncharacterized protein
MLELAAANLLAPPVLFFALGLLAAAARSDLSIPEAAAKTLSIYLLLAIGFKGGVAARSEGLTPDLMAALAAGIVLSALLPLVVFPVFRRLAGLDAPTAAATAAHYGSISIVTFVAATDFAERAGAVVSGHMVAVAAAMESPAILTGLLLAARAASNQAGPGKDPSSGRLTPGLLREVFFNGSVVVLIGAFAIGAVTGEAGMKRLDPFVNHIFQGVLCLFLLDMGLVAARRIMRGDGLAPGLVLAALASTAICAVAGHLAARLIGASPGDVALLTALAASASYIAVPAAMRVALPEANPGAYLTASLGVTFPFNLTLGLPIYFWLAQW